MIEEKGDCPVVWLLGLSSNCPTHITFLLIVPLTGSILFGHFVKCKAEDLLRVHIRACALCPPGPPLIRPANRMDVFSEDIIRTY